LQVLVHTLHGWRAKECILLLKTKRVLTDILRQNPPSIR
jgi:hypothetical protein